VSPRVLVLSTPLPTHHTRADTRHEYTNNGNNTYDFETKKASQLRNLLQVDQRTWEPSGGRCTRGSRRNVEQARLFLSAHGREPSMTTAYSHSLCFRRAQRTQPPVSPRGNTVVFVALGIKSTRPLSTTVPTNSRCESARREQTPAVQPYRNHYE
jgi:hypothetical protein